MDRAAHPPSGMKGGFHGYTVADLLKMSQADLDALFTASEPGPIPNGQSNGTAIIAPGTVYSAEIATMVNIFAWQGKVFDAKAGLLRNRIVPTGDQRDRRARSIRTPAGWMASRASCWTIPKPRSSPIGSATRSG